MKMTGDNNRNSEDLVNSSPNDVLINNNNNNNNKRKMELEHDIDTDGSALSPRKHLNTGNSQVYVLMDQDELHSDNEVGLTVSSGNP